MPKESSSLENAGKQKAP